MHSVLTAIVGLVIASATLAAEPPAPRRVISLNGTWQVAEGKLDQRPAVFGHSVPVPGLVDMAHPPFASPGSTVAAEDRLSPWLRPADPQREAFWYRRTLTLDGPLPAVALLKVHKAAYTTQVFLNGHDIGRNLSSFTPGWFDLRPHLRADGQENELLIRVGASLAQVPPQHCDGWDNEKARYVPGIYDSVQLILSGTPHVVNVQTVPDIQKPAVRALVELANAGAASARLQLKATVREVKSGRVAGEANLETASPRAGQTSQAEICVPIAGGRRWTPEDPFLYELTVDTGADRSTTRFGLRTFAADPNTSRFLLNGRPYFLRGSNVCIFRFFEDDARAALPWDENWVRKLHRRFKDMHWNSLRYCIGFPPERWYEIADEEGILIQDEYPIWYSRAQDGWPEAITTDVVAADFTAWMRERWNHPCVVIWDAQNETRNGRVTGEALQRVRALDLSNRPWDNGWGEPQAPGDVWECHPYRSRGPGFSVARLSASNPLPTNVAPRKFNNVPLINEYGWLWINRDGSLPTLTVDVYERVLGKDATPAQRWHYYARTLAAKTEFWRVHRQCGGVLHFCGLGYSRPDGQTSDNFIDIQNLVYEPEFFRYVRDAFAPVGLMVNLTEDQFSPGQSWKLGVMTINDLDRDWKGAIALRLLQAGKLITEQTQACEIPAWGSRELTFAGQMPQTTGACQFEALLSSPGAEPVRSLRDFDVLTEQQREARRLASRLPSLALGKPVQASSSLIKSGALEPAAVTDGFLDTRWSSAFADPQWIAIDLEKPMRVSRMVLDWESAYAKAYSVEVSLNGSDWKEVYQTSAGRGATEGIRFPAQEARWVRITGTQRATRYGYSLREVRIFAD